MPSLSVHEALNCLTDRWAPSLGPQGRMVFPYIFWLFYPIFTLMWAFILVVVLVKLYWPMVLHGDLKKKGKFQSKLIEAGVTPKTAQAQVRYIDLQFIRRTADAKGLPSFGELVTYCGTEIASEMIAAHIMTIDHPPGLFQSEQHQDPSERHMKMAKEVRAALSIDDFSGFPAEQTAWLEYFVRVRQLNRLRSSNMYSSSQMSSHFEKTSAKDYTVLGAFRSTKIATLIHDITPASFIILYSIWSFVTQRYLIAVRIITILMHSGGINDTEKLVPHRVWVDDVEMPAFSGPHLIIGILGVSGLCFWSLGVPLSIYIVCHLRRARLHDFKVKRLLGFFYAGLTQQYFWWELLVKRIDVLLMLLVANTNLVEDSRAKLVAYLGISGFFWVSHTACLPFDARKCRLVDRIESSGLAVRFSIFLLLTLAMMRTEPRFVNIMIALGVVGASACFMHWMIMAIASEFFDASNQKKGTGILEKALFLSKEHHELHLWPNHSRAAQSGNSCSDFCLERHR